MMTVKNKIIMIVCLFAVLLTIFIYKQAHILDKKETFQNITANGTIVYMKDDIINIREENGNQVEVHFKDQDLYVGDKVSVEYTKDADGYCEITNYVLSEENINEFPEWYSDHGIFSRFYKVAYQKLKSMSLEEKIGQTLLIRYTDELEKDIEKYNIGGIVFYEKDFINKTVDEIKTMINSLQNVSHITLLIAVDEEGGIVNRVSTNNKVIDKPFKSSSQLYKEGGFELIFNDTIEKSSMLKDLGINLNLAPVVDVVTDPKSYMYARSLRENTELVSDYSKTVIEASKNGNVSYTLKHFPGYNNNHDTHIDIVSDNRNYEDIVKNDFPPFISGIQAGAEAIMFSHHISTCIDNLPASLSLKTHNILRDNLSYTGVIITDDLIMGGVAGIEDTVIKAINAENNLIITSDYKKNFETLENAILLKKISEEKLDKLVFKVIAWKYYKQMLTI